ncbi:MAG TPA: hypothetical protein VH062_29960 [Polyangiaceae bacterium]|nr:hypothetical protein [Polyangiaceae bacterium]
MLACIATGRAARADEPVRPELDLNPSSYPPPAARPNLMLVGAGVTAAWYGVALGTSYGWRHADSAPSLRIPVAGPYIALTKSTHCAAAETSCSTFSLVIRTVIESLSLVGQTGGVLAILEGAFVPTAAPARDSARTSTRAVRHVAVVPTPMSDGGGVAVFGEF